jgi:hypothetical protein
LEDLVTEVGIDRIGGLGGLMVEVMEYDVEEVRAYICGHCSHCHSPIPKQVAALKHHPAITVRGTAIALRPFSDASR